MFLSVCPPPEQCWSSKIPEASLMQDAPELKWVPSCQISLISVLCLKLTEESWPQFSISTLHSFDLLVSILQLTSFISYLGSLSLCFPFLLSLHTFPCLPPFSTSWKCQPYWARLMSQCTTWMGFFWLACVCSCYNSITQGQTCGGEFHFLLSAA